MKILLKIKSNQEVECYEAMALAMTLATFDNEVQIWLDSACFGILLNPNSRLAGMIKSLDLYDLPKAWLNDDVFSGWLTGMLEMTMAQQLTSVPETINLKNFDEVLTF